MRAASSSIFRAVAQTWVKCGLKKRALDAWYITHAGGVAARGKQNARAVRKSGVRKTTFLDGWFDSGSSHLAVLKGNEWPADVYLEGPDQYRGWFHSQLVADRHRHIRDKGAVSRRGDTMGGTLAEQGRPMSKSLGNVVLPSEICDQWGRGHCLRLCAVGSQEYQADVKMRRAGDDAAQRGTYAQDPQYDSFSRWGISTASILRRDVVAKRANG